MANLAQIVSSRVRLLRADLKLTQDDLASRTGYSIQYISKIENQPANISLEALERIAMGLEIDPVHLISEREVVQLGRPNIKRSLHKAIQILQRMDAQIID
jgi:transcriptional regulator with XRE-family HTH domain